MRVFVWKSYGNVEVHACETREQAEELLESVYEVALQNLYEGEAKVAEKWYNEFAETRPVRLINDLIELVGDGADMFEYGTGFTTLRGVQE